MWTSLLPPVSPLSTRESDGLKTLVIPFWRGLATDGKQAFEDCVVATSNINIIFQCHVGEGCDANLNRLSALNTLLSISKTTDGFDTALGVSPCPAGWDLLHMLMVICSMQKAGGYVRWIYSRLFLSFGTLSFVYSTKDRIQRPMLQEAQLCIIY